MENKDKVISFNGHRCCIFGFDNIEEAVKAMNFEFIKDYGDTFLNEDGSIKHYLHTWDDGERRLVRCKNCGAYFIRQAAEHHSSEDSYYIDWYQVESPDIAEKLNEIYSGWALEAEYKAPGMFMTNGKYHWNNANDIRDRQMELIDREESESKCEKKVLSHSTFVISPLQASEFTALNYETKQVNRITVDYHRVTRIKPKQPISDKAEYVTWDYTEQLIVDRESETLEHTQNIGTGCIISRKYKTESGVEDLLDNLDADYLFGNVVGNPLDAIEMPNETTDYTITVDFENNTQRMIRGTYDKNGLPDNWAEFAETVFDFMKFYGLGEILDPSIYDKVKRCKSDYIYCSVTFDEGYKSYYYLADDDSIEVGDYVLVPAGKDNHTAIVEVVNIEYFSETEAPLPVEKTKHIIRKCTEADFE